MQTHMDNVYLVPQKSTFEIQDFTYVYVVDSVGVAKVRSFQPLERISNFMFTQDLEPGTVIVYEGIQSVKDGDEHQTRHRELPAKPPRGLFGNGFDGAPRMTSVCKLQIHPVKAHRMGGFCNLTLR